MTPAERLLATVQIKKEIRECRKCHLSNSTCPVPHSGWLDKSRPSYAIVGEAPGPEEAKQNKPFVGPSGKFLRKELEVVTREGKGLPTDNTVFLNTVNCWPRAADGSVRPPTAPEREACRPWLIEQLEILEPDFVLVVGTVALQYWWKNRKITESRGRWWTIAASPSLEMKKLEGTLFISTYHPSAVIREKGTNHLLKAFRHDLLTFYEVGAMMWTARRFGVEQTCGAELEWLEEQQSTQGTPNVHRRRGGRKTTAGSPDDNPLFT